VNDALLTTDDAAALLGVPSRTVEDWRLRRMGPPYVRLGRHVRYRREDLVAWLEENTVRPR
jgi:excisionase family DNA binding protein